MFSLLIFPYVHPFLFLFVSLLMGNVNTHTPFSCQGAWFWWSCAFFLMGILHCRPHPSLSLGSQDHNELTQGVFLCLSPCFNVNQAVKPCFHFLSAIECGCPMYYLPLCVCMLSYFNESYSWQPYWTVDCWAPLSMGLQARILEGVAMPSSRRSSWPRDQTHIFCSSCIADGLFTTEPLGKPITCP